MFMVAIARLRFDAEGNEVFSRKLEFFHSLQRSPPKEQVLSGLREL